MAPVSPIDRATLAERTMAVERHLRRVADRLPAHAAGLTPASDVSDAVVLHLWQATQIVIDQAMAACLALRLGAPATYADAFRRLHEAGIIPDAILTERLIKAAGFRNVVAHAYETLDLGRVHEAARTGPADLLGFLALLAGHAAVGSERSSR
jgi:uncharacterized protein YutE (UPF0331/DUF86 family)